MALSNAALEAAAAARSGRYTLADGARQQIGRAVAQLLAVVDSALAGMANAVVAAKPTTPRQALRVLRASWRASRERAAKAKGAEAATMKALIEDDQLALIKEDSLVGCSRSSSPRAMAQMALLTMKHPLNASVVALGRRQQSNWRRRKGLY